jgi:putative phage-type endonuclease
MITYSDSDKIKNLLSLHETLYNNQLLSHERDTVITGSEAASFLGVNRFESAHEAMWKKVFSIPGSCKINVDNEAIRHGKKFEPIAIKKYEVLTGNKVRNITFIRHPNHPWLGGTIDGLVQYGNGMGGALLEVKCPFKRSIGKDIPRYYIPQIQLYLSITGLSKGIFLQYKPSELRKRSKVEQLSIIEFDEDFDYQQWMIRGLRKAWVEVMARRNVYLPYAILCKNLIIQWWRRLKYTNIRNPTVKMKLMMSLLRKRRETIIEDLELEKEKIKTVMPDVYD